MKMFRLVLCLAGLGIYLVMKQFLPGPAVLGPRRPLPNTGVGPGAQQPVPKTPRPQTRPHIEVLKPETSYAEAK